jgi:hypothetical protein
MRSATAASELTAAARARWRGIRPAGQDDVPRPGSPATPAARNATHRSTLQYALGNGGALLCGLLVAYLMLLHSGLSLKQFDFLYYYSGSRMVLEGLGSHIYDLPIISRLEASLAFPLLVRDGGLPYIYPPYLAVALAPVAALPYDIAYLAWLAVNSLLLALTMSTLERYALLTGRPALAVRLAAFASLPVLVALFHGQTSILLAALLTASFFAARAGREMLAGSALAFTMVKPQYTLPFVLLFLLRRRWKALAAFALTALALFTLPMLFLGLSIDGAYLDTMRATAVSGAHIAGFDASSNRSFAGAMQLLLPAPASTLATLTLDLIALLVLARSALRSQDIDLPFGLALLVALLISPHTLVHDLTLLLLPVAVALRYRLAGPHYLPWLLGLIYLAILIGFFISFVYPFQLSVPALLALGFWLVLAAEREYGRGQSAIPLVSVPAHSVPADVPAN